MSSDYLEYELQIERAGEPGLFQVAVLRSPAGETLAPISIPFPFAPDHLENLHLKLENALLRSRSQSRRAYSPEEATIRKFGSRLFESVFRDDVRSLFYESKREAERDGKGLRLKLRLQDAEFAALPWEFLLEPRADEYLCLSRDTPMVRYLDLPGANVTLAVPPPLRILGMVVSPKEMPSIDVARERAHIEAATAGLRAQGLIELRWIGDTVLDLQRALRNVRRDPWHIFHFVGHGEFDANREEGILWLANENGRPKQLTGLQLARLLADHGQMRLAILNACEGGRSGRGDIFSGIAATLIRRSVPAVLAMQYEISEPAAVLLARMFYESLADGLPIDGAMAEARKAISMDNPNTLEWGTPVLFTRAPDGVLFDLTEEIRSEVEISNTYRQEYFLSLVRSAEGAQARRSWRELRELAHKLQGLEPNYRAAQAWLEQAERQLSPWVETGDEVPIIGEWELLNGQAVLPERIIWEKDGREMRLVPAGSCRIGLSEAEAEEIVRTQGMSRKWVGTATPVSELWLPDFYMDVTPVTRAEYARFAATIVPEMVAPTEETDHPAVNVNWFAAKAYCEWSGKLLPSETQWEKGARGVDGRIYPWGNDWDRARLNSGERIQNGEFADIRAWQRWWQVMQSTGQIHTSPVAAHSGGASPYGLLDMAGNVWEWCDNWFQAYPGSRSEHDDYGMDYRVVRGGSWGSCASFATAFNRGRFPPNSRLNIVGFRSVSPPLERG